MAKLGRVPILLAVLLLRFALALGNLECEDLSVEDCAFAVSSTGARCVLEKSKLSNGETSAECQTSIIMAEKPLEWIETDECIKSCGLERVSYGLSTDALMEKGFTAKLCSAECQNNCPNIVDLYVKLAAGEGLYLPRLCISQKSRSRRLIADPLLVARAVTSEGWIQKKIAPGPLEAAAYSPASSPYLEDSQAEITPASAPESATVALRLPTIPGSVVHSTPPAPPIPTVPGPLSSVATSTTVAQNSVQDLGNDLDGEDY